MHNKPVFHLYIPKLLEPLKSWFQDFLFDAKAPQLASLLTHHKYTKKINIDSLDRAFFVDLNPEINELPIAFFRHQVQKDKAINGLICADPVHLEVGMNDVTLTDKITDLTDAEANEFIYVLNKHFTEDGLQFIFGSNQCWYVSFPEIEFIESYDLDSVLLKNIVDKSVNSKQRNWQVIQNETQMLLHGSALNKQREVSGLKPVNSLWFWGAGKLQESIVQIGKIYSRDEVNSILRAATFAKAANCETQILPNDFNLLINKLISTKDEKFGAHVLLLDQLFMPALENRLDDFQNELKQIDKQIIAPLLYAWRKHEIDIIINDCGGNELQPMKQAAWKFWSKPMHLRDIIR